MNTLEVMVASSPLLRKLRPLASRCAWLALGLTTLPLQAVDWPSYRGPSQDNTSPETIRTDWSTTPPKVLWKKTFTAGWSSLATGSGRVFTQDRRRVSGQDREFCVALDAATGNQLWAVDLDVASYPDGGTEGHPDGPRSTPTVDGDRVYVLTTYLKLYALEVATGKTVWMKDFVADHGATLVSYQNAASPLVVGNLIFVNGNAGTQRLFAINKADGTIAWRQHNTIMTHATPVHTTIEGTPQVVFFTRAGLYSVTPETGALLWSYSFAQNSVSTAASPVADGSTIYASASYGTGTRLVRVSRNNGALAASEVWRATGARVNHWATPVKVGSHFYGIYGAANNGPTTTTFRCIDGASGTSLWQETGLGRGGVIAVSGHLLVLSESGDLVLVAPNTEAYTEVARFHVLENTCWNHPIVSNGRIYARSATEVVAVDVASAVAPKARLVLSVIPATAGGFELVIATDDNSPIDAARAAQIEIAASTSLSTATSAWVALAEKPTLVDGKLRLQRPASAGTSFLAAREPQ